MIGASGFSQLQPSFSLNGLGRSYIINNTLTGDIMNNDTKTHDKGIGGYNLFDLQNNIGVDSIFQASATYRVRGEFGGFFGSNTSMTFRQFKLSGKIKNVKYEIGDIRVQMSPFTVYNYNDMYQPYETEIFALRRSISEYENLNKGNGWLLQGAQIQDHFAFKNWGLGAYGFAARTSPTNEMNSSDRLLTGARLNAFFGNNLSVAANYVGLNDIDVESTVYSYHNQVETGEIKYSNKNLFINFEGGNSNTNNSHLVMGKADTSVKSNDYFADFTSQYKVENTGITLSINADYVGPYFSNPAAQTRRIIDGNTPSLFKMVHDATTARTAILFDRLTSEQVYNARINSVLSPYLHEYNNALPYGKATPNRTGASFIIASDTSMKNIHFEVGVDYLSEIFGEGTTERRTFLVTKGAALLELGKMMELKRKLNVSVNARMENTHRANDLSGGGSVQLSNLLVDAGISYEIVKKLDILTGVKLLNAKGNEFNAVRNVYNVITNSTAVNINSNEMILSAGLQVRVSPKQAFTAQYNYVNYQNKIGANNSYLVSQLFISYTGKF